MASIDPSSLEGTQREVVERYGTTPAPFSWDNKVGVARNVRDREAWPLNGLRHLPTQDVTGWYLWAGEELSDDPEFFVPLHARHLMEWRPEILPYLLLPPGWRFLVAPDYEDVWEDPTLLDTA